MHLVNRHYLTSLFLAIYNNYARFIYLFIFHLFFSSNLTALFFTILFFLFSLYFGSFIELIYRPGKIQRFKQIQTFEFTKTVSQ